MHFYDIVVEDLYEVDMDGYKPLRKSKLARDMCEAFDINEVIVKKEEIDKYYICSDFQFGDNPLNKYVRGFTNVWEMDEHILSEMSKIPNNSKILHLGDFSKLGIDESNQYVRRLPIIENVVGNHDVEFNKGVKSLDFAKNNLFRLLKQDGDKPMVVFTHYPISPHKLPNDVVNFHGHLHKNEFISRQHRNFVVEVNNYEPIKLIDVVEEINENF